MMMGVRMQTFLFLALLLNLIRVNTAKQDILVSVVRREIFLLSGFSEVSTTYELRLPKESTKSEFVVCLRRKQAKREAFIEAYLGENNEGVKLEIGPVEEELDVVIPDGITCQALKFPVDFSPDNEEMSIFTRGTYVDVLSPLPEKIRQQDTQRMVYKDTLYSLIPYSSEMQMTSVNLPSEEVLSKTLTEPHKQEGSLLFYGPFQNLDPFSSQSLSVHYVHDKEIVIISKAVKEIQVSAWGNIYVNEIYEVENGGAQLKGGWSRLDYQKRQGSYENVIEELKAQVPSDSHSFYYTDDIGNVSTSKIFSSSKGRVVVLRPRYPLFGGWTTKFFFGYSTGLSGFLWHRSDDRQELHIDFAPSIFYPLIKDYELRVVLPDGSSDIQFDSPFKMESSLDTKYWYFDVVSRPVLVLKKSNVLALHQVPFKVNYHSSILAPYRKPLVFFFVFFGLLVLFMVYIRMTFEIVGTDDEYKEKIKQLVSQLRSVFKQRQELFGDLKYLISEIKNGQLSRKSTTEKNKIQADLKESNKKVVELKAALKKWDYNRITEIDELISKEKDFELLAKKAGLLEEKSGQKHSKDDVSVMEKTASHLAAGMQDAFENLFRC